MIRRWRARRKMRKVDATVAKLSSDAKQFLLQNADKLRAGWGVDAEGNWHPPRARDAS